MEQLAGRMYTAKKRIGIMIELVLMGNISSIKFYEWLIAFANDQIKKLHREETK